MTRSSSCAGYNFQPLDSFTKYSYDGSLRYRVAGSGADGSGFFRVDGRWVRPASLDIAERVGAHAGRLAALRGEPRLDEVGEPVAERAGARELHIAMRVAHIGFSI